MAGGELVIDTSALIAVVVNETEKPALVRATAGATLLAPASVPWEIGNAFSAMLKRGRITLKEATTALSAYERIPLRLLSVDLEEALTLSAELGIYAYDAYLLVAARAQRCGLLSLDRGLIHAARRKGIPVVEVSE